MILYVVYGNNVYEIHTTSKGKLLYINESKYSEKFESVVEITELPFELQDLIYQTIYKEVFE